MGSERIVEFYGYRLCINEETYEPSDDTKLLLDIIKINKGEKVVEVGSGSGILGLYALIKGASNVIFIDINPYATLSTLCTMSLYNFTNYDIINCNLLDCLRNKEFDVAIFNPPYLPVEEFDKWIGYSWSGGKSGVDVLVSFLKSVKARRIYTLYSSLDDLDYLFQVINELGYRITRSLEKTIGFETLTAIEIKNDKTSNSGA